MWQFIFRGSICCSLLAALSLPAATLYVDLNSPASVAPFTNWDSAATNIQDALDAASDGDIVLVTNGIYATGGRPVAPFLLTNRVLLTNSVTLQSVNGPSVTTIQGYQVPGATNGDAAVRCVYLSSNATLAGFTLAGGATRDFIGPYAEMSGGGSYCDTAYAVVSNCVYVGNSARYYGGGAASFPNRPASLYNCVLVSNTSLYSGGAAFFVQLFNCFIANNLAASGASGIDSSSAVNCTIIHNSGISGSRTAAARFSTLNNCILYSTSSPSSNYDSCTLNYCCTTPLPATGTGNFTNDPQMADFFHLLPTSPCRYAGNANITAGVDLDGDLWANPPDVGCDQYVAGAATGPLSAAISAPDRLFPRVPATLSATISGRYNSLVWDFGDGSFSTNSQSVTHTWTAPGNYRVVLRVRNDSYPSGVSTSIVVPVMANLVTHFVSISNSFPLAPFTNWATAATNIQDAVDAASPGDLVLVSNGVYQVGSRFASGTNHLGNRRVDSQIKTPGEKNWGEAKGFVDSLIKDTGNWSE